MENIFRRFKTGIVLFTAAIMLMGASYTYVPEEGTGDLKIVTPTSSVRVEKGDSLIVRWLNYSYSSRNISRLRIELYRDKSFVAPLAGEVVNNGRYEIKIPDTIEAGRYRIKLTSIDGTAVAYSEDFTVIDPVPITIIQPSEETVWRSGDTCIIRWQTENHQAGAEAYITLYKKDEDGNLKTVMKIAEGVADTGELKFDLPYDVPEGTYVIGLRITTIGEMKYSHSFRIVNGGN